MTDPFMDELRMTVNDTCVDVNKESNHDIGAIFDQYMKVDDQLEI